MRRQHTPREIILRLSPLTRQRLASAQEETKSRVRSEEVRAAEVGIVRKEAGQVRTEAGQARAMTEEDNTEAATLTEKLVAWNNGRIVAINIKLIRLRKSLANLEPVLRYELLVRLIKGINAVTKDFLTSDEITLLRNAKFDWVAHLVKAEEYNLLPEEEQIAYKVREYLPAAMQDLVVFCAAAAHHYAKGRPKLQYPIPTRQYAQAALLAIAHDLEHSGTGLNVAFAHAFIEESRFFTSKARSDPRQDLEDYIADLEAEKAARETRWRL
ncbi:hypothetical protein C8J57DRAFT_1718905 [Mycena rebaudengoi]|nr:hypothetical protein C8J57DRAFT_1718905 [Mycena rebaudengoi]